MTEYKTCTLCRRKRYCRKMGLRWVCDSKECFERLVSIGHKKGVHAYKRECEKREKEARAKHRERKLKVRPLSKICSQTQTTVNRFIRLVDIYNGHKCISCGIGDVEHAGHLYHAGSKWRCSRFRFSHIIIHGQCVECNHFAGGGNEHEYRKGIIARYGVSYLNKIERLKLRAEKKELEPITKEEVLAIKAWHAKQANVIEKVLSGGSEPDSIPGRIIDQW